MNLPCLRQSDKGVELMLYVQPRASRNQIVGLHEDALKVKLTAPPVDGAANKECTAFLAKLCKLPKNSVQLVAGDSSRHKRFLLVGIDASNVESLLVKRLGT